MKRATPEAAVLKSCKQILTLRGVSFWRINAMGSAMKNAKGKARFVRSAPTGFPDIVACIRGRFVAIEVKGPEGKQSEGQAEFQSECERAGGVYWLVKSSECLDELIRVFVARVAEGEMG